MEILELSKEQANHVRSLFAEAAKANASTSETVSVKDWMDDSVQNVQLDVIAKAHEAGNNTAAMDIILNCDPLNVLG